MATMNKKETPQAVITCKKVHYPTRRVAETALEIGQEEKHYDKTCGVYFCFDCNSFHIGHSNK
jgi:hypothetical protein